MAWSDEARQASIEARKASAKARGAQGPEGREGKIKDHREAQKLHEVAAEHNRSAGNLAEAEHHDKMAALHEEKVGFHQERVGGAAPKSGDKAGSMRGRDRDNDEEPRYSAKQNAAAKQAMIAEEKRSSWHGGDPGQKGFASGKEADQRHIDASMQRDKDDGHRASAATKIANHESDEATKVRDADSHAKAGAAHIAAAAANKVAGNKEQVKFHEKMAEKHEALEKSYKGVVVVERGREAEKITPSVQLGKAGAITPSRSMDPKSAKEAKTDREIASGNARLATEKARSSGKAEDHDAAADAHMNAKLEHDEHQQDRMRDAGSRHHEFSSPQSQHHQKMYEQHSAKAQTIRTRGRRTSEPATRLRE